MSSSRSLRLLDRRTPLFFLLLFVLATQNAFASPPVDWKTKFDQCSSTETCCQLEEECGEWIALAEELLSQDPYGRGHEILGHLTLQPGPLLKWRGAAGLSDRNQDHTIRIWILQWESGFIQDYTGERGTNRERIEFAVERISSLPEEKRRIYANRLANRLKNEIIWRDFDYVETLDQGRVKPAEKDISHLTRSAALISRLAPEVTLFQSCWNSSEALTRALRGRRVDIPSVDRQRLDFVLDQSELLISSSECIISKNERLVFDERLFRALILKAEASSLAGRHADAVSSASEAIDRLQSASKKRDGAYSSLADRIPSLFLERALYHRRAGNLTESNHDFQRAGAANREIVLANKRDVIDRLGQEIRAIGFYTTVLVKQKEAGDSAGAALTLRAALAEIQHLEDDPSFATVRGRERISELRRSIKFHEQVVLPPKSPQDFSKDSKQRVNNFVYALSSDSRNTREMSARERMEAIEVMAEMGSAEEAARLFSLVGPIERWLGPISRLPEPGERTKSGHHTLIVASGYDRLEGIVRLRQGRPDDAIAAFSKYLLGLDSRLAAKQQVPEEVYSSTLSFLAEAYLSKSDWRSAEEYFSKAIKHLLNGRANLVRDLRQTPFAQEQGSLATVSALLLETMWLSGNSDQAALRSFELSQHVLNSSAGLAINLMAARTTPGDQALSALVRKREDKIQEWLTVHNQQPSDHVRLASAILQEVGDLDGQIERDFPSYSELRQVKINSVNSMQQLLGEDEVLAVFLFNKKTRHPVRPGVFLWLISRDRIDWLRPDIEQDRLSDHVVALRCGLDSASWLDGSTWSETTEKDREQKARQLARRNSCIATTGVSVLDQTAPPFDVSRAHELYKSLFGHAVDRIQGKRLIVVPSGPLTTLPFQVLVTEPPKSGDHRDIRWLARDHAITVLPAVSSLKALRQVAKPSAASKPMIGFGNPLLIGNGPRYTERVEQARQRQRCPETPWQRLASAFGLRSAISPLATPGGRANVHEVRAWSPLPETAGELCAVARNLSADPREIRLGAQATEREIKRLSATGALAQYRIVHFATHGALAGQLESSREPGLILTPPATATDEDDGYLTASEIAGLKLDAEWVILSACNTAGPAGGEGGADALSGLARAFFYAQARALLVSHWEVDSDATVALITLAVGAIAKDKSIGRAEALRRAMLTMIDKGEPHQAHPAYWAPFVVVGEGAAAR